MRAAAFVVMACGWLALGVGMAAAQDANLPPAVETAFHACTEPGRDASVRFALLDGAGWRVAPDEPLPTAFGTLAAAERFAFLQPGTPDYDEFIGSFAEGLRDRKDAGLPSNSTLTVAAMQPILAEKVAASVQMSTADQSAHLVVFLSGNGIDQMTMECSLFLTSPIDDATRIRLSASRGFDESHGHWPPSDDGTTSVVYKRVGDSGPEDPWTVGFSNFGPDSTLAHMAKDLAQPVTVLGIIRTRSLRFAAD